MKKYRMETFSDGVFAIIMTIMVLELTPPKDASLEALTHLFLTFFSYVLSFVFIGIYWNNHHHLLHLVKKVNWKMLWGNMHLLFWVSLIPFTTAWMGKTNFQTLPVALYGVVLLMAGISYMVFVKLIAENHKKEGLIQKTLNAKKIKLSILLYAIAIPCAFLHTAISHLCYIAVSILWVIPDRQIEKVLETDDIT